MPVSIPHRSTRVLIGDLNLKSRRQRSDEIHTATHRTRILGCRVSVERYSSSPIPAFWWFTGIPEPCGNPELHIARGDNLVSIEKVDWHAMCSAGWPLGSPKSRRHRNIMGRCKGRRHSALVCVSSFVTTAKLTSRCHLSVLLDIPLSRASGTELPLGDAHTRTYCRSIPGNPCCPHVLRRPA